MYCNKCGQTLPEGSRFCNSCGSQTVATSAPVATAPSEAYGSAISYADERVIFVLRPTLIFVAVRYVIAGLIVIATAALMGFLTHIKPQWFDWEVALFVVLGVGIIAFANPVYKHIQRRREVYTLTNHKLEMRHGIIAKVVRNIPLSKIQDVTVTASVWQRFVNMGDIEIDSASEAGKIILDDIHKPEHYADLILAELRRRN